MKHEPHDYVDEGGKCWCCGQPPQHAFHYVDEETERKTMESLERLKASAARLEATVDQLGKRPRRQTTKGLPPHRFQGPMHSQMCAYGNTSNYKCEFPECGHTKRHSIHDPERAMVAVKQAQAVAAQAKPVPEDKWTAALVDNANHHATQTTLYWLGLLGAIVLGVVVGCLH